MSLPPPELEDDEDDELELDELEEELEELLDELLLEDEEDELELLDELSDPMQAESTMAAPATVTSFVTDLADRRNERSLRMDST